MLQDTDQGVNPDSNLAETSVSGKVIVGSLWIFGFRISNRLIGLLRTIILARLLLPEDFGLIGIAVLSISTLETFSQPGLGTALVQKTENIESYLNTTWTASIIRSCLIYAILYFSAPFVTSFFNEPEATIVIRVFGISVLIAGFRNVGVVYFQKELNFRKQYIYELLILLGNIAVALPAAYILQNVWALVLGGLAGSISRCIFSYLLHPFRPKFNFNIYKFKELFNFGKWILGSSILAFLVSQGDDIFLAKMFGTAALGLYQMAYMISNLPTTETARVISHVTFPAYSKIQNDTVRFQKAYIKVLQMITFIAAPAAGAIYLFAQDIIPLLISENWIAIVPILKILVWAGLMKALIDTTSSVFNAAGKPKINVKLQIIDLVLLLALIYPASKLWGVVGVSIAVLTGKFIAAAVSVLESKKILNFRNVQISKILLLPLISMLFSMLLIAWIGDKIPYNNLAESIILLSIGVFCYGLLTFIFDLVFNYNMGNMIKTSILMLKTPQS